MKPTIWIKRFVIVFIGVFSILFIVGLLKKRPLERVTAESAVWAGISAVVFVTARGYHLRKGRHCELCGDKPETSPDGQSDVSSDGDPKK